MIHIKEGDMLKVDVDIICHQVNCMGAMGSGIAKQIKDKYFEVYEAYINTCKQNSPKTLLGSVQYIECHNGRIVANLFGQLKYGKGECHTNYEALKVCLNNVKNRAKQYEESVALPFGIGCGLGGGNWNTVYEIIEDVFRDYEVTIYKFH